MDENEREKSLSGWMKFRLYHQPTGGGRKNRINRGNRANRIIRIHRAYACTRSAVDKVWETRFKREAPTLNPTLKRHTSSTRLLQCFAFFAFFAVPIHAAPSKSFVHSSIRGSDSQCLCASVRENK